MGVYTNGSLYVALSRKLTDEELAAWIERCKTAPEEQPTTTDAYGWHDPEDYNPDNWDFAWKVIGDVGHASFDADAFTIEIDGKVYDITEAAVHFVDSLPPDVTGEGDGTFESDGEHWGLRVRGREVKEIGVSLVVEPETVEPTIILVEGGIADVWNQPQGVEAHVIDLDVFDGGDEEEVRETIERALHLGARAGEATFHLMQERLRSFTDQHEELIGKSFEDACV